MHVLSGLRRGGAGRPLPELRGELVRRPIRPAEKLAKFPASTERKLKPQGCGRAA
jgi:hypothetical protein